MEADRLTAVHVKNLYEKHGDALVVYACCCGLDFAAAEDAVQQVFLKLLRGETSVPRTPIAYLYRAVRNASFNLRHNRKHETGLADQEKWFVHGRGAPQEVLALQTALRELPEEQREVVPTRLFVVLRDMHDTMGHHSHPTTRYRLFLTTSRGPLELQLCRDSQDPHEYWVFYPGFDSTKMNDIGHVFTNALDGI